MRKCSVTIRNLYKYGFKDYRVDNNMEISEMKPLLPLDFSLSVKSEGNSSLTNMTSSHKADGPMLLSPEKGSSSAFKVVTPKNSDGK